MRFFASIRNFSNPLLWLSSKLQIFRRLFSEYDEVITGVAFALATHIDAPRLLRFPSFFTYPEVLRKFGNLHLLLRQYNSLTFFVSTSFLKVFKSAARIGSIWPLAKFCSREVTQYSKNSYRKAHISVGITPIQVQDFRITCTTAISRTPESRWSWTDVRKWFIRIQCQLTWERSQLYV